MATYDTPGTVTITPNARLCRRKSMAVARGLAVVKLDKPFLVKLCNFGEDQVIVRKNSTLGFAEPDQGPMLSAVLDENNPKEETDTSVDDASRDPFDNLEPQSSPRVSAQADSRRAQDAFVDVELNPRCHPCYAARHRHSPRRSAHPGPTLPDRAVQTADHCSSDQQDVEAQRHCP